MLASRGKMITSPQVSTEALNSHSLRKDTWQGALEMDEHLDAAGLRSQHQKRKKYD